MPRPTPEQLERINRFTMAPLTADDCYVFDNMMIDDRVTFYDSIIHQNLLNKFMQDALQGTPLILNHDSRRLPVGRAFDARMSQDYEKGQFIQSLYGCFYIDLGRRTESNMTTDDIVKGIEAGTIFDTSIGFSASSWVCNICGNDIRDYMMCSHFPGEKYVVSKNGLDEVVTCQVIVGEDGAGELLENSLVYSGACNRATIRRNFSADSVTELKDGTKLRLVDNFKNIPLSATIYGYYTKDGSVLFTDTDERTSGVEELRKRSEREVEEMQKVKEVLSQFHVSFETPEELASALENFVSKEALTEAETKLSTIAAEKERAVAEKEQLELTLGQKDAELATANESIAELQKSNSELLAKAEVAETYRNDLIEQTLEAGVRAQGNAFQRELFAKFLQSLSLDEIKDTKKGFEEEFKTRFASARTSEPSDRTLENRMSAEPKHRDDFETDEEFRAFVATKAVEYAKENQLSVAEATKQVYKQYTIKSE